MSYGSLSVESQLGRYEVRGEDLSRMILLRFSRRFICLIIQRPDKSSPNTCNLSALPYSLAVHMICSSCFDFLYSRKLFKPHDLAHFKSDVSNKEGRYQSQEIACTSLPGPIRLV